MTIYQDSKRIVALEADVSNNIVTINHRCSTTDDHAYADLGSALSNTSWVMRYKMVISGLSSSGTNPNNSYLFAISKTTANNMSDQSLGLKMRIGGGTGYLNFIVSGGTSSQNGGEGYEGSLFSSQTVANGTWYVEYIRNGSSFSIRLTTSSDYTGGELDTWATSGTVEDLRYIKYTNRDDHTSSHVCVCTISDIKIYDGVTSATGTFVRDGTWTASASNKVTVALEANKPTDVQDNTILLEKDTGKRYWFDADPTATTETVFDATTQSAVSTAFCYSGYAFSGTRFGTRIDAGFSGIGKYIKKIMLPLDKTGSPTGNCWYAVFDSSNVEKARTNTKDVSTLPTTSSAGNAEDTELTLESAVKLEAGDIVAMVYEGGSSGNYPQTYSASTSLISNTTPMKYTNNTTWDYRADRNIWFKFDSDPASITLPATWTRGFFNPTDTALFSTSTGWTGDTSIFTNSGDTMVWDTSTRGTAVVKTITTLPTSGEWVMRFKVTRVSGDAGDGSFLTLGSSSAPTSTLSRMQNGNGLYPYGIHMIYFANANNIYIGGSHDTSFNWDFQANADVTWSVGDSRWVEVSHASSTAYTTKVYSNANFTGTADLTSVASPSSQTLDYDEFAIGTKWGTGRKNMIIEDMQIWNGVTSPP